MKILDVEGFHSGIAQLLTTLNSQQEQMNTIKTTIEQFVALDEAFKGNGGEAIRTFYRDYHLPFLVYFDGFVDDYKQVLQRMKERLRSLEGAPNGMIVTNFLEGEVEEGLTTIRNLTMSMTDEGNQILNEVRDIVNLPSFNDEDFLQSVQQAKEYSQNTVEKVQQFDYEQVTALSNVIDSLQLMLQYIKEVEGYFGPPRIGISRYTINQLAKSESYQQIQIENVQRMQHSIDTHLLDFYGMNDPALVSNIGSTARSGLYIQQASSPSEQQSVNSDWKDTFQKVKEFEIKDEYNKSSVFGTPGLGNFSADASLDIEELTGNASVSLIDSNKALLDKGEEKMATYQRMFYGEGSVAIPTITGWKTRFETGQLIGGKAEAGISHSKLDHEKSPASLDFKLGKASANAGIENYSLSAGAKAEAVNAELKIEPFNLFGFEPLEEWFGIEYDPYFAVEVSLGSIGASASVGMENELYAAYGIGLGLKFGAEKDEE